MENFNEQELFALRESVKFKMRDLMSCYQRTKKGEILEFTTEQYNDSMEILSTVLIKLDKF